jgi:ELWxxDGT repeat protein
MKKKLLSTIIASFLALGFYAQQYGPIVIVPGSNGSEPRDFKKLNNLLIFTASDSSTSWPRKIFRSDGTYAGTYELNSNISVWSNDSTFVKLDNFLYFCGTQNSISTLWRTDGSVNGTTMVYGGGCGRRVVLNQNLYFLTSVTDPTWGTTTTKLMKHEPLSNLTTEVYNWNNSNLLNGNSPLRVYNNKIYFYGWQSDGTTANTIQNNVNLPSLSESCVYNGLIYYRGNNGKLWRTDGTISGTFQAVDFPVWFNGITVFNNLMYFDGGNIGAGLQGIELCKSDGTLSNTAVVKDIYFGYNSSYPSDFSVVNGSLYFLANDGISGREIYKTDGTSNGTVLLKDIEQGISDSFYPNFYPDERYNSKIEHQNQLFFNINQNWSSNNGIWKSDGTTANTNQVFQIDTTRSLMDVNGILFFAGYTQSEGWELYAEGLTSEINENSIHSSIKISPNPTSNIITIQGKEDMHQIFKIFDQMGREVYKGKLNGITTDVYLTNLSKGIYTLKIDGNYKPAQIVKE